jgi:CRP/FNR family transcriptional regulator
MNKALNAKELKAGSDLFSLSELNFLSGMDMDELDKTVYRDHFGEKGDCLYREGDACKSLYVIRSGSLKITTQNSSGISQIVGFHLAGELIGFDGFATNRHACTAQFIETASVSEWRLETLDDLCKSSPSLLHKIYSILGLEINTEHELLWLLGRMNGEEKLAIFLLNFSSRMKQHHWKESEFNLSMPRQDIANYLGVAVETISRLFEQFRDDGLIDVNRRHIKIIDKERLNKIIFDHSGKVK